jgi:probable rRNA maturation factor
VKRRIELNLAVAGGARGALGRASLARLRRRARRMLAAVALSEGAEALSCSLSLVDDAEIHRLNQSYRGKDRPTDVLAFAMREGDGEPLDRSELGDVIISVDTARRQAKGSLPDEVFFLWSHGLCHLLGYDHRTDAEEAEMNERMRVLRLEGARGGPIRAA